MKNLVTQAEAGSPTRESGEIRERPIIFTGESVRGILAGRKTQTRRIVKRQPVGGDRIHWDKHSQSFRVGQLRDSENAWREIACPYGRPGDRLWVREAWRTQKLFDRLPPADVGKRVGKDLFFEADRKQLNISGVREEFTPGKARVSIFMPRWASRITLEITDVRVEQLQEISEADARAEGCMPELVDPTSLQGEEKALAEVLGEGWLTAKCDYMFVWDSINKKAPWSTNPWVWVIEFRPLEPAALSNSTNLPHHDQPTQKESL